MPAPGNMICAANGSDTICNAVPGDPMAETCNGVDDDCDGALDEDFAGLGAPCVDGVGACEAPGTTLCAPDGSGTICDAVPGVPQNELCDGLDNDCDGALDEDFAGLGDACSAGLGACRGDGTITCTADGFGAECTATAGAPGAADLCGNGLDDNCDGQVDEGYEDLGGACSVGLGACESQGTYVCRTDGLALQCNAEGGVPVPERCGNGIDDDCDGLIDQADSSFEDLGQPCTEGLGICATNGTLVCGIDGTALDCDAVVPAGSDESCGNGLDDDCDGQTDEGFDTGVACTVGLGECARDGLRVCTADGAGTECNAASGEPAPEVCDGLDNDCDGEIDEACVDNLPPTASVWLQGNPIDRGTAIEIIVSGTDNLGITAYAIEVAGQAVEPLIPMGDGMGALVDFPTPGFYEITGRAFDAAGNEGVATETIRVLDPDDVDGPTLALTAPSPGAVIDQPTDFAGTADDANLVVWTLAWAPAGTEDYAPLASGDTSVVDGVFATVDPRDFAPGDYVLRLGAEDINGRGTTLTSPLTVPVCDAEICDGADNDCDGIVDDGFALGQACTAGTGACAADGLTVCAPDQQTTICDAATILPATESCDGLDNDCDGQIDEDFDPGSACTVGAGICAAPGVTVCAPDGTAPATARPGIPIRRVRPATGSTMTATAKPTKAPPAPANPAKRASAPAALMA